MMNLIAKLIASRPVREYLACRAFKTPYSHLPGYMGRWWLFNPYEDAEGNRVQRNWLMRLLPSIRVHHIQRADNERHLHDHPWDARTIILRGWYVEMRERPGSSRPPHFPEPLLDFKMRRVGDTARLNYGQFHRISEVSPGGVWTLFITYRYRGTWGFLVDGVKVPWRKYLGAAK